MLDECARRVGRDQAGRRHRSARAARHAHAPRRQGARHRRGGRRRSAISPMTRSTTIGKKAEDKRTDEEKVRARPAQEPRRLSAAKARSRIAEARRKLQDLAAEDGVDRGRGRARRAQARARAAARSDHGAARGRAGRDAAAAGDERRRRGEAGKLTSRRRRSRARSFRRGCSGPALAQRQLGMHDRVEEVARASVGGGRGPPPHAAGRQARRREAEEAPRAREGRAAVRHRCERRDGHARTARSSTSKLADAVDAERDALVALAKAIEQFADLKQTIDIASRDAEAASSAAAHRGRRMPTRRARPRRRSPRTSRA